MLHSYTYWYALGVRWYDTMTAPYNFLNYAAPTGWFGWDLSQMGSESLGIGVVYMIVVLLLIFIGIGLFYILQLTEQAEMVRHRKRNL